MKVKVAHIKDGFIKNIAVHRGGEIPANGNGWTYMEASAASAAGYTREPVPIDKARKAKIAAIDAKTTALLATGVEYPAGSGHFHALDPDRIPVYEGAKNNRTILAYPKKFRARTGGIVTLANANEVAGMYAALLARYEAITAVGTELVEDALAATTTAELEAIVDDRT